MQEIVVTRTCHVTPYTQPDSLPQSFYKGTSPIKKRPTPQDPPRTPSIGLRYGYRVVRFLVSDVPLYVGITCTWLMRNIPVPWDHHGAIGIVLL